MTAREALKTIQEFVELAMQRRVSALPAEQRTLMEALDEKLRDQIDGAKPKPRNIENPSAVAASARNLKIGGLAQELNASLGKTDAKKIRDISTADLPRSLYTPSSMPAFMSDYYDDDLVPTSTSDLAGGVPTTAVLADGTEVDLMDEVKVLFGLAEPAPSVPAVPERPEHVAVRPARRPSVAAPQLGRPTIVHFVAGGTRRGEIAPFEPTSGKLCFVEKDGSIEEVPLGQVLAIFFGLLKGEAPSEPSGDRMIITLINDKRVVGLTDDYREGGEALTLVPDPRRGNIDRIWIPASAVKALELA